MYNYSTITEDFDYNKLDIQNPEHDTVSDLTAASDNIKIPIKTLFAHFFEMNAPGNLTSSLNFGLYHGWENPDNKKPKSARPLIKKHKVYYDNTVNNKTIYNNSETITEIKYFNNIELSHLMVQGFQLLCNQSTLYHTEGHCYPYKKLSPDLIRCINEYIHYVTGHNYDFTKTLYGKSYKESTGNILYYQIFVSQDDGLILVDHIIEYPPDGIIIERNNCIVKAEPISMAMGALIFTNLKVYEIPGKNSLKLVNKIQHLRRTEDFVTKFDYLQQLNLYDAYLLRDTDQVKSYIRTDKAGHIWYGAAHKRNMFGSYNNSGYSPEELDTSIIPTDLTKELDVYFDNMAAFTGMPLEVSLSLKCCLMHPKIRGYIHKLEKSGFIVYTTNDPEFCENLLGPGAAEYIKNYCCKYRYSDDMNCVVKLYSFVWYTDYTMKIYDEYMDNPDIDPTQIKSMLLNAKIQLYDSWVE